MIYTSKETCQGACTLIKNHSLKRSFLIRSFIGGCLCVIASFSVGANLGAAVEGGYPAPVDAPVALVTVQDKICSGFHWKQNIVITNAHCVTEVNTSQLVPLNQIKIFPQITQDRKRSYGVKEILIPPNYVNKENEVSPESIDVAFLILSEKTPLTPNVRIATETEILASGLNGFLPEIIGYGRQSATKGSDELPNVAPLRFWSPATPFTKNTIALRRADDAKGACKGDSGSPIFLQKSSAQYVVAGILAGSFGGCGPTDPTYGTYTHGIRLLAFKEIIQAALESAGQEQLPTVPTEVSAQIKGRNLSISWQYKKNRPSAAPSKHIVMDENASILCIGLPGKLGCSLPAKKFKGTYIHVQAVNDVGEGFLSPPILPKVSKQ